MGRKKIEKELVIKSYKADRMGLLVKEVQKQSQQEYANLHSQLAFEAGVKAFADAIINKYGVWRAK